MSGDVGLIGMPNAGKSSFMEAVCPGRDATPRVDSATGQLISKETGVGHYAFTTLAPRPGNVKLVHKNQEHSLNITDLPGLIKGASRGRGLGLEFLAHAERCRSLAYIVDLTSLHPIQDYLDLRHEVHTYFSTTK